MLLQIIGFAIEFVSQTVILLLALWIMIKVQKLNYKFLGLLGTAALGSGLDMIPVVGHYVAVVALYICIWKLTRADLFPDAVFTVVVAYALMFCMNLFVIGALMGDLRPSARSNDDSEQTLSDAAAENEDGSPTNQQKRQYRAADETLRGMATPEEFAEKSGPTTSTTASPGASSKRKPSKANEGIAKSFSLKGVTISPNMSMAAIHTGTKAYTIVAGETLTVQTAKGGVEVRCDKVTENSVVLSVDGAEVELFLH